MVVTLSIFFIESAQSDQDVSSIATVEGVAN